MQQVQRARGPQANQDAPAVPPVPGDVEQAVRAPYAASVAAGAPMSQRAMADLFGLSRRKAGQLAAQVTASGNGHLPEIEEARANPWIGQPWYAEIEDFDAWVAEVRERLAQHHTPRTEVNAEQQERNDGGGAG